MSKIEFMGLKTEEEDISVPKKSSVFDEEKEDEICEKEVTKQDGVNTILRQL